MNKNFNRMSLEKLRKTLEFQRLTPRQQLYVATYIETGAIGHYDAEAAVRMAYRCSTDESVRVMKYAMKRSARVVEVLNMHFGKNATDAFLEDVSRAIRNKSLTGAQVDAMILKSEILGIGSSLSRVNRSRELLKKRREKRNLKRRVVEPVLPPPVRTSW